MVGMVAKMSGVFARSKKNHSLSEWIRGQGEGSSPSSDVPGEAYMHTREKDSPLFHRDSTSPGHAYGQTQSVLDSPLSSKVSFTTGKSILSARYAHTSREVYHDLLLSGVVGEQEGLYLTVLRHAVDGLTDGEAALAMGLPRSTVSARRNGIMRKWQEWCEDNHDTSSHVIYTIVGDTRVNPGKKSAPAKVWRIRRRYEC